MDEPTHANENRFWDDVADWIIDSPEDDGVDNMDEIDAMLRDRRDDFDF